MLILGHYLAARYAPDTPLSVAASITFEQSYGPVDGDSASLAELCALLSALASLPIRQSLAMTGSVNQFGEVQPIGGVNQKIEGFFDTCGLLGRSEGQGVLIPQANVKHLMLRTDVVSAAAEGLFNVHPISNADEAMTLLTGYPADTIHERVEARAARAE